MLKGKVEDVFSYYLESETDLKFEEEDEDDDGTKYGIISVFLEYRELIDEDGYSPPKYLITDGVIYDIAMESIEELCLKNDWEPCEYDYDSKNWSMDTVYVFENILTSTINKGELKDHKRTRYNITIKSKKKKKQKTLHSVK